MFEVSLADGGRKNGVTVRLKPGREKPVLAGHPWLFSGAVAAIEPNDAAPGSPCTVLSSKGEPIAWGYINQHSQIVCRICGRNAGESWSGELVAARLERAAALRKKFAPPQTDCLRLVNSEGDFLPGVVIDRYGEGFVLELTSAGADSMRETIVDWLQEVFAPSFIYENSTGHSRSLEKLERVKRLMAGELPDEVVIKEYGHRFRVQPAGGQKTGFYLDQRENRHLAGVRMPPGGRALDLFSYTGAFSVYLAAAGAGQVVSVDSSGPACAVAESNLELNGYNRSAHPVVEADVFEYLRSCQEKFELVVADPPPLARRRGHVDKASRAYKDLNRLALGCLAPGGVLLTFSCSAHVDTKLFGQIAFSAAVESGRRVRILARLGPGFDHPVDISHPEGEYLKGLLLQAE